MDMKRKIMVVVSVVLLVVAIIFIGNSLKKMFPKKNSETVMDPVEEQDYLRQQFPDAYN